METPAEIEIHRRQCVFTYLYLNQSALWFPRPPRRPVKIADMDPIWRTNAVRFMERRAGSLAMRYHMGRDYRLAQPMRAAIGEVDGQAVEGGPSFTLLDMMSDHVRDALDRFEDEALNNPVEWLRTTALIRALNQDLPIAAGVGIIQGG